MIELHLYMEPYEGKEIELETIFLKEYIPSIENQPGFKRVTLLKKRDALREYQMDLTFDTEESRLKWIDNDKHNEVWPKMAVLLQRATWSGFNTVE